MQTAPAFPVLPTPDPRQARRVQRSAEDADTRRIRLRRVCEALEVLGLVIPGALLHAANIRGRHALRAACLEVLVLMQGKREDLAGGEDEPRRIKLGSAIDLIGALWCVS